MVKGCSLKILVIDCDVEKKSVVAFTCCRVCSIEDRLDVTRPVNTTLDQETGQVYHTAAVSDIVTERKETDVPGYQNFENN